MSELENDYEVEQENDELVEEVEAEEVEESSESETSELAPDSDAEHEEQPQDEHKVNQEKVNQVINRKHREAMEAKEEAERLRKQLEQYTQQQQTQAPEILPAPDPFDDDYESKVKARDESIMRRAQWESDQKRQQEQQQYTQQQAQKAYQDEINAKATGYVERAKSYGISNEELQKSDAALVGIVSGSSIAPDLASFMLEDDEGPLITTYLAGNPMEAYELTQMNAVQAALHLERVIRPKAAALKPKKTSAPKPATKVKTVTGDKDLGKYRNLGNASFE